MPSSGGAISGCGIGSDATVDNAVSSDVVGGNAASSSDIRSGGTGPKGHVR